MATAPHDCRTREQLLAARGPVEWLHFYGHTPADDGSVTAACLSQWWAGHPFTVDGVEYLTAEHWMMAAKARAFEDDDALAAVLASATPKEAKALGRRVTPYDDDVWKAVRYDHVVEGSVAKFGAHDELREFLLATGDAVLVEAAPRDRIWGIGMGAANENAQRPDRWRGQNLLGFALMEARSRLSR